MHQQPITCSIDCLIPMNVFTIKHTTTHTHKCEAHSLLDLLIRALLSLRPLRMTRVSSDSKLDSSIRLCERDFLRGHESIVPLACAHTTKMFLLSELLMDVSQCVWPHLSVSTGGPKAIKTHTSMSTSTSTAGRFVSSSVVFCYDATPLVAIDVR